MHRLSLLVILAFVSSAAAAPPILILGAVPQEIVPIRDALKDRGQTTIEGIPCDTGTLGGHDIILALTGIGKTNAALVTTALVTHCHPSAALMCGTAARIRASVRTGDIIIAATVTFHDVGSLGAGGMTQEEAGPDGKMAPTQWFSPTRDKMNPFTFPSTPELVAFAEKTAADYHPPEVNLDGATYQPNVRVGKVATGDLSGVTEVKIADLRSKLDPDLMEMESAAFAQVCQFFKVPHLVIRSGSNQAKEKNMDDYLRMSPIAARQAALFTVEIAGKLPPD